MMRLSTMRSARWSRTLRTCLMIFLVAGCTDSQTPCSGQGRRVRFVVATAVWTNMDFLVCTSGGKRDSLSGGGGSSVLNGGGYVGGVGRIEVGVALVDVPVEAACVDDAVGGGSVSGFISGGLDGANARAGLRGCKSALCVGPADGLCDWTAAVCGHAASVLLLVLLFRLFREAGGMRNSMRLSSVLYLVSGCGAWHRS